MSEEWNVHRMQGGSVAGGGENPARKPRPDFDLNLDLNLSVGGEEGRSRVPSGSERGVPSDTENFGKEGGGRNLDAEVREHLRAGKTNARREEEGRRGDSDREARERGEAGWSGEGGQRGQAHSESRPTGG